MIVEGIAERGYQGARIARTRTDHLKWSDISRPERFQIAKNSQATFSVSSPHRRWRPIYTAGTFLGRDVRLAPEEPVLPRHSDSLKPLQICPIFE